MKVGDCALRLVKKTFKSSSFLNTAYKERDQLDRRNTRISA